MSESRFGYSDGWILSRKFLKLLSGNDLKQEKRSVNSPNKQSKHLANQMYSLSNTTTSLINRMLARTTNDYLSKLLFDNFKVSSSSFLGLKL